jgi:diguanylate cyclase (GGDEF)-like protein
MPNGRLVSRTALISGVLAAVLLATGGLTWAGIADSINVRHLLRRSTLVVATIKDLDIATVDAETGQRGFLLTGDAAYLAPYTAAILRIDPLQRTLVALTAGSPTQQKFLQDLAPLLQQKQAELAETIRLADGGPAASVKARDLVDTDVGRFLMMQIEATLAGMAADEQTVVADLIVKADNRGVAVRTLTMSSTLFAILTLLWATRMLHLAATTDALTGLLSRNRMWALMRHRAGKAKPAIAGILCVDLDRFRSVNQVFGPAIGDRLLVEVAQRLTPLAGKYPVGRLGSDDFVISCTGISMDAALQLGASATAALACPFEVAGHSFHLTASVGIAHTDVAGDVDLRQGADDAMYVAKLRGGNQSVAFVRSMHQGTRELAELEQHLHVALDRDDQLSMAFQPIVSVHGGGLVGWEALARWHHPELGVISPDRFIKLAETTGLIIPLGLKLMRLAVRQAALWHRAYPGRCPILNVNLSPVQFSSGDVVGDFLTLLGQYHLPATAFCIEVTEGVFTNSDTITALENARASGFDVSMDDFGVGYSSLAQLPRLPLTSLKLDRSFIERAESSGETAMLSAIVQLAHALQLKVIAEGVERPEQLALLAGCGCDTVQGYFICRPQPAEALDGWMSQDRLLDTRTRLPSIAS